MKPLPMIVEDLRRIGVAFAIAGGIAAMLREQVPVYAAFSAITFGAIIWVAGVVTAIIWRDRR